MATKGIQDVSSAGSIKVLVGDINTWITLSNQLTKRQSVILRNNGVNNDLATGVIYVSILNTSTTEAGAVTLPRIAPLSAGQSIEGDYSSDIYFHVQADTANACIFFHEADSVEADAGLKDS